MAERLRPNPETCEGLNKKRGDTVHYSIGDFVFTPPIQQTTYEQINLQIDRSLRSDEHHRRGQIRIETSWARKETLH
jgi:hypothetical protein